MRKQKAVILSVAYFDHLQKKMKIIHIPIFQYEVLILNEKRRKTEKKSKIKTNACAGGS